MPGLVHHVVAIIDNDLRVWLAFSTSRLTGWSCGELLLGRSRRCRPADKADWNY